MSQTLTKEIDLGNEQPQTWHYGLVANYWAEFHHGGPEIAYFQKLIERFGQPALIVAAGRGGCCARIYELASTLMGVIFRRYARPLPQTG